MKKRYLYLSLALLLAALCMVYGCGSAATSGGGGTSPTPWIFCGNTNGTTITVIDGTTNTTAATIELGTYRPYNMAVSPDNKKGFCSTDTDDIIYVDTTTNATAGVFTVTNSKQSTGMVVSHDGKYLYMTGYTTTEFFKIDLTSGYTFQTVQLIGRGSRIALNSDSTKAYICVGGADLVNTSVEVINLQTMTKEASINVINHPYDITIMGNYAYIAMSSIVKCVARINLSTYAVETMEKSPVTFHGIVSIPGQDKMYISNFIPTPAEIYVLRPEKWPTPEATVISSTELVYPQLMAATENYAYVMDGTISHNRIAVIDVKTDAIVKFIYGLDGSNYYSNPIVVYK